MNTTWYSMHARQTILFCIIGGIGAVIDMGSLFIMVHNQIVQENVGFFISACAAMGFVFLMNKFITFQSHTVPTARQLQKFIAVYIPATIANTLLSSLLLAIGLQYLLAKMAAIACIATVNYMLSHYFIFKK